MSWAGCGPVMVTHTITPLAIGRPFSEPSIRHEWPPPTRNCTRTTDTLGYGRRALQAPCYFDSTRTPRLVNGDQPALVTQAAQRCQSSRNRLHALKVCPCPTGTDSNSPGLPPLAAATDPHSIPRAQIRSLPAGRLSLHSWRPGPIRTGKLALSQTERRPLLLNFRGPSFFSYAVLDAGGG